MNRQELRDLQHELMNMLLVVDLFCKKNGIEYCIESGTALGAKRHSGFIPWDDDLDICMDRSEYIKFCKLFIENPPEGLELQTHSTDKRYVNGYAKIRHLYSKTKEDRININYKHQGLFLDVFPYEQVNPFLLKISHLCFHRILFYLVSRKPDKLGFLVIVLNFFYYIAVTFDKIFRLITKILPSTYSQTYGCNIYAKMGQYNKEMFFPCKVVNFEGHRVPGPSKIEEYLNTTYGDYMKLPPIEQRNHVHYNSFTITKSLNKIHKI